MALQSSQRLPELLFYTKKSYRILQLQFQLQFYKSTHTPSTYNIQAPYTFTHPSREFSIQNPILHAEDKELFEYYYYILRAKRPSFQKRNSMHRRQGDLLEIHSCVPDIPDIPVFPDIPDIPVFPVFPNIPVFPVFPDTPDIPVIPDTPETFRTFQSFMTFQPFQTILQSSSISRESTPLQHSPIRMHILQFDWFPQKLHRVPVEQLQTFYKHYILQRKGDFLISVKFVSVKMSR